MKKDVREIIRRPLVTEKSTRANEETNKVTFVVRKDANKIEIKRAVEEVFGVNVLEVRTLNNRGKKKRVGARQGRKPDWKKAVVSLREGDRIDLFEGVLVVRWVCLSRWASRNSIRRRPAAGSRRRRISPTSPRTVPRSGFCRPPQDREEGTPGVA